jgi:hypothetical protein
MLQRGPSIAELVETGLSPSKTQVDKLADLPSAEVADHLVETVFLYTQARYCIVDWVQIYEWHSRRETICYSSQESSIEAQIGVAPMREVSPFRCTADIYVGAYFLWIIYAIGADLVQNTEHPPKVRVSFQGLILTQ